MERVALVVCCLFALSSAFRNESESLRCGQNEVPACVHTCPPERTCKNRHIVIRCAEDPDPCTKKCVCAEGYYRNFIGECITKAQCEQCDAPNEFYSCNSACDNVCEKLGLQNRTHCPIRNIVCNKWCYCEDGYARDDEGNCVPVEDCPKKTSDQGRYQRSAEERKCQDPNEVFTCKRSCPPETCISTIARFKCDSREACKSRCACKPGFLRLEDGTPCVPECQCPQIANTTKCLGQ